MAFFNSKEMKTFLDRQKRDFSRQILLNSKLSIYTPYFFETGSCPSHGALLPFFRRFLLTFFAQAATMASMKSCRVDDGLKRKMWHECSLLCQFLSESHGSLSQETELELSRRVLLLMEKAIGQDAIPDPF